MAKTGLSCCFRGHFRLSIALQRAARGWSPWISEVCSPCPQFKSQPTVQASAGTDHRSWRASNEDRSGCEGERLVRAIRSASAPGPSCQDQVGCLFRREGEIGQGANQLGAVRPEHVPSMPRISAARMAAVRM